MYISFSYVFRSKNTVYCEALFQTRLLISIRYIGLSSGKSRKRQKGNNNNTHKKKMELKKKKLCPYTHSIYTNTNNNCNFLSKLCLLKNFSHSYFVRTFMLLHIFCIWLMKCLGFSLITILIQSTFLWCTRYVIVFFCFVRNMFSSWVHT